MLLPSQQRREEQNAMALNSPLSEELIRTGQWIQDNRGELALLQTAGLWPNSNHTAVEVTPVRSGTPKDNDSPASNDTDAILEGMTYVGGMNYAKYRLDACRAKTSGKQKTRPPTLCVQDETVRDGATSTTSSRCFRPIGLSRKPLLHGLQCCKRKLKPDEP